MLFKFPLSWVKKYVEKLDKKFLKSHKTFGNFSVKKDLAYIEDGNKLHQLDILSPVLGSENGIVLFYIHGGAYIIGEKDNSRIFCSYFTNQGFTVIAINYRFIDNSENIDFTSQMKDIFAALSYIYKNKVFLGLKLDKFCLMGDSAGGHMALMTDIIYHSKEAQEYYGIKELPDINIRCLGLNSTMYDYEGLYENSHEFLSKKDSLKIFSKNALNKDYLKLNSPRYYIEEKSIKLKPIFNSTSLHDQFKNESLKFKLSLAKYGLNLEHYFETSVDKKIGHVFNHFEFEKEGKACNDAMIKFFKAHCNVE
ncbi:MAG: alpha/beta hydrolase [Bacilli bacterium]|nr:alpha/beta hydrolase [Bacilli bacterium]